MRDLKSIIGYKIQYIRECNNMSQLEFVEKLDIGMSRGYISRIESGHHMPSAEFIKAVCSKFNVSPYWILDMPESGTVYIDPLFEKYNLLNNESKKIIQNLISILYNNTK